MVRNRNIQGITPIPQQNLSTATSSFTTAQTSLPYYHCTISLENTISHSHSHAVCDAEGHIYAAPVLIAFVRRYHKNPLSGAPMSLSQIIPLKFHLNDEHQITCPISGKVLMSNKVKVACIRTTGNVYAYSTIQQMCLNANDHHDLLTRRQFNPAQDLIILQDPEKPRMENPNEYWYVTQRIAWKDLVEKVHIERRDSEALLENSNDTIVDPAAERILREMEQLEQQEKASENHAPAPQRMLFEGEESSIQRRPTTKSTAGSFTSTTVVESTPSSFSTEKEQQYDRIRDKAEKGYARVNTTLGALDFELFTHLAPMACENFMVHAKQGYYNSTIFHRIIPGFMCQGGDPTGTGRGGQSIWGKPFEDEFDDSLSFNARGILACANKGPNTNQSQWFVTFAPTPHLNHKHTIFGRLIESEQVLSALEKVPTGAKARPLHPPQIESIVVTVDPFERDTKRQQNLKRKETVREASREENSKVGAWYSAPQPKLAVVREGAKVGKYLPPPTGGNRKRPAENAPPTGLRSTKRARTGQFNFSKW